MAKLRRIELGEAKAPLSRYAEDLGDDALLLTVEGKPAYALVPLSGRGRLGIAEPAEKTLAAAREPAAAKVASPGDSTSDAARATEPAVTVYTDGGCIGNPGPGGYGAVILDGAERREVRGGFRRTTNNRMEIMAAIEALEALPGRRSVTLYSDSQYLVKAMTEGWAERWRARGWMRTATDRALNPDLWQRLLDLCRRHDVSFRWVRGHAGHAENERAHRLSVEAASSGNLPADTGYRG